MTIELPPFFPTEVFGILGDTTSSTNPKNTKGMVVSSSATALTSSNKYQSIYFKNLQLLGFNVHNPLLTTLLSDDDKQQATPLIPEAMRKALPELTTFTEKSFSSGQLHSAKYLELIIYFLIHCYKAELATSHFQASCWPVLDAKVQAKEFRLTAFKVFEQIKKEEAALSKFPLFVIRKSFLDDSKSERFASQSILNYIIILLIIFLVDWSNFWPCLVLIF